MKVSEAVKRKRLAGIRKALKLAHTPEANTKRAASIRAHYQRKKAEKAAALQARYPVVVNPDEKRPKMALVSDLPRRAYTKAKQYAVPQDREEMVKAHLAIMLKLLHG